MLQKGFITPECLQGLLDYLQLNPERSTQIKRSSNYTGTQYRSADAAVVLP